MRYNKRDSVFPKLIVFCVRTKESGLEGEVICFRTGVLIVPVSLNGKWDLLNRFVESGISSDHH